MFWVLPRIGWFFDMRLIVMSGYNSGCVCGYGKGLGYIVSVLYTVDAKNSQAKKEDVTYHDCAYCFFFYSIFFGKVSSMHLEDFSLFLFDLDGLLVDSESLHRRAYMAMCEMYGYTLSWDLDTYLSIAGRSSDGLRLALREEFPALFREREWRELYACKQQFLYSFLEQEPPNPMPGAQEFVQHVFEMHKPMAVVTHSPKRAVSAVRSLFPIDTWITREDYDRPKPAPDGYMFACRYFGIDSSHAIGFEDTEKGMQSLRAAHCHAILIQATAPNDGATFSSFYDLLSATPEYGV